MRPDLPRELVLAVAVKTRGIAFAHFEGPLVPVDWGIKDTRGRNKNARGLATMRTLIDQLQPDVLILEAEARSQSKQRARTRRLCTLIGSYAASQAIDITCYSRADIRVIFEPAGAVTRYEIAEFIAGQIPAFSFRLPPERRLWESEDRRMALFDAAALAITYFSKKGLMGRDELYAW